MFGSVRRKLITTLTVNSYSVLNEIIHSLISYSEQSLTIKLQFERS